MALENFLVGTRNARKQEQAMRGASEQSDSLLREMFEKGLALNEPFRQAGLSGLQSLVDMGRQEDRPFSFDYGAYFNSPEYAALSSQQEAQTLSNAGATGGLRSGNSQAALATIAPQLAQQGRENAMADYSLNQAAMMDRYNRLQGITGLGLGVSQQASSQAAQLGQGLSNNAYMRGQAMANKYGNNQALFKGLTSDIASAFKMGGF